LKPEREAYIFMSLLQASAGRSVVSRMDGLGPQSVLDLAPEEFCGRTGLSGKTREAYLRLRQEHDPAGFGDLLERTGTRVDTLADATYPEKLREIPDPPPALFRRGKYVEDSVPAVAIVGSRKASAGGVEVARELGRELGERGVCVVSGLALGIDAAAHAGALGTGGHTLGVLGCGIDVVYPRRNARLFERVVDSGGIISEYAPGEAPLPWRFPARNRVIAGLADVVVVVEASEKSGSLITARHALEQGREVWAVPGNVRAPEHRGSNKLLSDGAGVLWDVREFADLVAPAKRERGDPVPAELPEAEARVLSGVGWEPTPVDVVAGRTGAPMNELLSALALLELKGYVARSPGNAYVRRGVG
jgi:DNA processing protein